MPFNTVYRGDCRRARRARIPIGAQGGCTLLRLADFCGASRMMLAKIRALRQFSFGCFVRRTRRMKTARKKRCAIHLTRSKELFQPDARSDLPHLGPGLRHGRCGRVGSPEGVGRGRRNTLPPPLAQRSANSNKKTPACAGAWCRWCRPSLFVCLFYACALISVSITVCPSGMA